jgi:hypothetical protein
MKKTLLLLLVIGSISANHHFLNTNKHKTTYCKEINEVKKTYTPPPKKFFKKVFIGPKKPKTRVQI